MLQVYAVNITVSPERLITFVVTPYYDKFDHGAELCSFELAARAGVARDPAGVGSDITLKHRLGLSS